jgi:acetylornithine/N-succinyldiaminopimelate aminotransferase
METCRKRNVAVWADEVQTFGRTLALFHFEQLGLGEYVDVVTIGKLSQACACLYTEAYNPKPGLLSGTFIASTMALRTGARMIERLRDGGHYGPRGRHAQLFDAFAGHVRELARRHPEWFPPVTDARGAQRPIMGGVGGMQRFTPFGGQKQPIMTFLHALYDLGVIAFYCGHGPYHVRFLPPVGVMKPEDYAPIFEIVEHAMGQSDP